MTVDAAVASAAFAASMALWRAARLAAALRDVDVFAAFVVFFCRFVVLRALPVLRAAVFIVFFEFLAAFFAMPEENTPASKDAAGH